MKKGTLIMFNDTIPAKYLGENKFGTPLISINGVCRFAKKSTFRKATLFEAFMVWLRKKK